LYDLLKPHVAKLVECDPRRNGYAATERKSYAAVDLVNGPTLSRVSSAPEAYAENSNLLKTP
jgi:hypothetical protein